MKKCIIIGAGEYGQIFAQYLADEYEVVGFLDDNKTLHGTSLNGVKVLGGFSYVFDDFDKTISLFVPIGNNKVRVKLLQQLVEGGFDTPSFVRSSSDVYSSCLTGKAIYILGGTNIMPLVKIEDFVMISIGVNIGHHTILKSGVFLAQGTNIGGAVEVGPNAFFGIGSTAMTGVRKIGKDSVVGAGAVIIKDVPDNAVVVGNPGRIIKYNTV